MEIPKWHNDLIENTFTADHFSLASFHNLILSVRNLIYKNGPLPPSRIIRPKILVYWNTLKGGVEEFSRALKTLACTNASEIPIVRIIGRVICSQVGKAIISYIYFYRSEACSAPKRETRGLQVPNIQEYQLSSDELRTFW